MSKTLGTTVDPIEAAARFGPDPLRLYLVKEIAFGGDGDFSWARLRRALQRRPGEQPGQPGQPGDDDGGAVSPGPAGADRRRHRTGWPAWASRRSRSIARRWTRYALHEGAAAAFSLVDATNEYIAATAPWTLAKDPAAGDRLTQVLFDTAEAIRLAAVMLTPIMPASSAEILRRVGAASDGLTFDRDGRWRAEGERLLVQDGPLWPRKEHTTMTDHIAPPATPGTSATEHSRAPVACPSVGAPCSGIACRVTARPALPHPAPPLRPPRRSTRGFPSTTS